MIKFFNTPENELLWFLGTRLLRLLFLNKDFGDYFLEKYGKYEKNNKLIQNLLICKNDKYEEDFKKEVYIIFKIYKIKLDYSLY
jgi:hypothetical protein